MASFFEKLKKGMGVEMPKEKERVKVVKEKLEEKAKSVGKKRKPKKLEVETSLAEPELKKEEPEALEIKEETEKKTEESKVEPKKEKWLEAEGQLAVDVYQTETELVIQSAIAGIKPEDLDISIEADNVLIKGKREQPPEVREKNYFYQECYWGPFSRQIILPEETDSGRAEALMKEGVLIIRIPKIERKKKRKITVQG
jgi:HSP20 family protein